MLVGRCGVTAMPHPVHRVVRSSRGRRQLRGVGLGRSDHPWQGPVVPCRGLGCGDLPDLAQFRVQPHTSCKPGGEVVTETGVDLAGDVALEAANGPLPGLALAGAALDVGAGFRAVAQTPRQRSCAGLGRPGDRHRS